MASKIKSILRNDGLWPTSLPCPESFDYGEVSGTGFYTFALAWGVNHGILDRAEYLPTIQRSWAALVDCQHKMV